MPTVSAPAQDNNKSTPVKPTTPPAPPQPMTTKQNTAVAKNDTVNVATVIFIIILLSLCGLFTYFVARIIGNTPVFTVDAPVLKNLPEYTSQANVVIEGTAVKGATIEIPTESGIASTTADKEGNFKVVVELKNEGLATFKAKAQKRVFFKVVTSDESNTVSTTYDKTAPNLKLVTPPKTVSSNEYTIQGSTSEPTSVTIKINDKEVTGETDKDNNFSVKVQLNKGENKMVVVITDKAGNKTESAQVSTTFATGTVTSGRSSSRNASGLPNSSGELAAALNTVYGRFLAVGAVILAILGFAASSGTIWLVKTYKKS